MPVLLGGSDNCSFKGKLMWLLGKHQHSFLVPLTKGKYAAWEDDRQLEKGYMKMDFRRKLSDNEV